MVKCGIDWTKIAIGVNDLRKSGHTFDQAYQAMMRQYPAITGETWVEGKHEVGRIMASWKKKKEASVKARKSASGESATKRCQEKVKPRKTRSDRKANPQQGNLDL